jgi:GntP family gluconate:H+ symporter
LFGLHPLIILGIGVVTVLGMIIVLRLHAFVALLTAAIIVSLLAPAGAGEQIERVAGEFGRTAGKIGIVIALAAVIGRCLIESGAADRIVRAFVRLLGEKRCPIALMSSGFVLSVPVFFDTVFYLLLPLARSMHRRTGQKYVLLILAMGAGASITHSLVPPTPGPLYIASDMGIDLGLMIMMGLAVGVPTAVVTLFLVGLLSRRIEIPMRPIEGAGPEPEPLADEKLPGLLVSLLPIILPVILISVNTIVSSPIKAAEQRAKAAQRLEAARRESDEGGKAEVRQGESESGPAGVSPALVKASRFTSVLGDANLAMLLSAAIALSVLWRQRRPSRRELARTIESALMSGGVIILITSAGGAFGAMLQKAEIGEAIRDIFTSAGGADLSGTGLILMAFFIAFLLKFAQGSSTVSMMTTSGIMVGLLANVDMGFHPVYVATAIGFGAQCGNWMNDSGFWIFAKMSGLTEVETLKTWTVTVSSLAFIGLGFTILFARLLPLV